MTKINTNEIAVALWGIAFAVNCVAASSFLFGYLVYRLFVGGTK